QRHLVAADRVDELDRQALAGPLEGGHAGEVVLPFDRDARLLQDADHPVGDFGTDAISRNQSDRVRHLVAGGWWLVARCYSRAYQERSTNPTAALTAVASSVRPHMCPAAVIASTSATSPTRTGKPCGGGPISFIAIKPTSI